MAEPLMDLLAKLPEATPDADRAGRLQHRCRARLEARARSTPPSRVRLWNSVTRLWQPVGALVGLAYVAAVIVTTLEILRRH